MNVGDKLVVTKRAGGWPVDMFGKGLRIDVVAAHGDRVTVMYPGLMQAREFLISPASKPNTFQLASEARPERVLTVERITPTPNAQRYSPDEKYASLPILAGAYRGRQLSHAVVHVVTVDPVDEFSLARGDRALCGYKFDNYDGAMIGDVARADCERCIEKYEKIMGRAATPTPNGPLTRGARGMAQREHDAYEKFIDYATGQHGFTHDEANKILNVYLKHRLLKIDRIGGQFTFKHGAYGDRDVMLNALDEAKRETTPNTGSYYVWPLRTDGTPLGSEGPYGPHDLEGAKTFARIAATEGKHDRAVSRGIDPTSASFEIVRRYKAGSGNRVI